MKRLEKAIIEELNSRNLAVNFCITDFDLEEENVQYVLSSVDPSLVVPLAAREIVDRQISAWKKTYL